MRPNPSPASADYVVVGGGSAGAAVARRLADAGADVLLLEAGGRNTSSLVRMPGMVGVMHGVPAAQRTVTWGPSTTPQADAAGRQISQMHGRGLGGGSAVNAMIFARGHRTDYDAWAADGCPGWSHAEVLPAFRRLETFEDGASQHRGGSGPVGVARAKDLQPVTEAFLDALAATAGVAHNDDYNGAEQEGVSASQWNAVGGRRQSSGQTYLDHTPGRLRVVTGAHVTGITLRGGTASGVEVATRRGTRRIEARREVVLSAGSFRTAQLLMLSGIGPAAHLREHAIRVVADLPVGDNLQDHAVLPMVHRVRSGRVLTASGFLTTAVRERVRPGTTYLAGSFIEGIAHIRTPLAGAVPDLQVFATPLARRGDDPTVPGVHPGVEGPSLTLFAVLLRPESRGTVRLASRDPLAEPLIDPRYLSEPGDVDVLAAGVDLLRDAMADPHVAPEVLGELAPGPSASSRDAVREDVRRRISSVYHPVGTCRMGSDERSVVDPRLRVHGVAGLRVVDASVIPTIPGGNTNAPAMMIAERAADLMLEDA